MKRRKLLQYTALALTSTAVIAGCGRGPDTASTSGSVAMLNERPIVLGYSNWAGWWPWAIAEEKDLFKANGLNVEMKWFDSYTDSMKAFAAGQLDGNSQTLNDTITFAPDSPNGQVVVLVNDNSAGNDKIIAAEGINDIKGLKGKKVAVEEGVVDDFLLSLALQEAGLSRNDVQIVPLETGAAAAAFVAGKVDAVGAFPPFWLVALQRPGSREIASSAAFPGAIPDLLVTSRKLIQENPKAVEALVKTWFDTRRFMVENTDEAKRIMAKRAGVPESEMDQLLEGTKFFTIEDNLLAFSPGDNMQHMSYAATQMVDFMKEFGFLQKTPDLTALFDPQFVKAYAAGSGQ
jgi:NitT/TauT family transport system substrate-binding protein